MSDPRFLVDPYKEWVARQEIPVHEGFGLDLLELDVAPWARLEAKGAFAHLTGRGDFVDMQVVEVAPGGKTAPQRHLYEEVVYVLAGRAAPAAATSCSCSPTAPCTRTCPRCRSAPTRKGTATAPTSTSSL